MRLTFIKNRACQMLLLCSLQTNKGPFLFEYKKNIIHNSGHNKTVELGYNAINDIQ
jgi:hypothetical protein